jgi:uncharacterized membrane protein
MLQEVEMRRIKGTWLRAAKLHLASPSQSAVRTAAGFLIATSFAAAQTTITGLSGLASGLGATPTAVSDGGAVVAGWTGEGPFGSAWRWTEAAGATDLGHLPAPIEATFATSMSADGSVIVGVDGGMIGWARPFRWSVSGGLQALQPYGVPLGVSADGTIAVGYTSFNSSGACCWTSDGAVAEYFPLSSTLFEARACSSDGSVVAMNDWIDVEGHEHAVRWDGSLLDIGMPSGWTSIHVAAMSADGTTMVGHGVAPAGVQRAFRWTTSSGFDDLGIGVYPGADNARALSVSGDGSTVVGVSYIGLGSRAFLWTPWLGMVDLQDFLEARGVDVSDWDLLRQANAISPDGSAIVGLGSSQQNSAFLVRNLFPTPWSKLGFGLAGAGGVPNLVGTGELAVGTAGAITLTGASPQSGAALFLSLSHNPTPFKGGLLVTVPVALMLPLSTGGNGSASLGWSAWPAGIPEGLALYFQAAVLDGSAPQGVALSNAVVALTP